MENLRKFDWILFLSVFLLFCFGLAAIYSVSLGSGSPDFSDFKKQIVFGIIGLLAMLIIGLGNYAAFRVYSRIIFSSAFILLLVVLVFGSTVHGMRGWFLFAGLGFQPVELAKVSLIILLAKFFSNRLQQFRVSKHVIVSLGLTFLLAAPVLLQPDLGSAMILFGLWFILLLLTGVKFRFFLLLLLIFGLISGLSWGFILKDYQKERIMVFVNPESDPLGAGYNVSQSIIAIGSGQLFGRGLGFGSQSQLKFIPEAKTDFIFAVIAEELGLFGVLIILGLWAIVFHRLFRIAKRAKNDFGLFLVLGVMTLFILHLVVNIGMNMGVVPVMGISLPLLSYGGSFLVVTFLLFGVAESVKVRS